MMGTVASVQFVGMYSNDLQKKNRLGKDVTGSNENVPMPEVSNVTASKSNDTSRGFLA